MIEKLDKFITPSIVYIDGGKNVDRFKNISLIRFYKKYPLHKVSGERKCAI